MKRLFEEKSLLLVILVTAALMRFWNLGSWSYTHDELGALVRLNYDSFGELLREGVQNQDTHPAFTQVFLYGWTTLFGFSEWVVRLPFAIAGILSVYLVFLIAKRWFGSTPALFSSLLIATLSFPILYSQLARPYSFGLLFSLWAVWSWDKLLFGDDKNLYRKAVIYGIATLCCMLTHYFSFFFAMIVAVSGFAFVNRSKLVPYLSSGAIALLLFLPHVSISMHQFQMGGVGQWLSKPGSDFLWTYILYGFNESPTTFLISSCVALTGVLIYHLNLTFSRLHVACILWFLLPFLAGYLYSVYVNPVIQYSTLLFSFPFLILFSFSFFKEKNVKLNKVLLVITFVIATSNTLFGQRYYQKEQFGVFKEINDAVIALRNEYGKENVNVVLNTSSKEIFNFYFNIQKNDQNFEFIAGDDSSAVNWMKNYIDNSSSDYLIYGWSNFQSPFEFTELIKRKYPCIIYDEEHFNSRVTLFGKHDPCSRDTIFHQFTGFEHIDAEFSYLMKNVDSLQAFSGSRSLRVERNDKFCITIASLVKNILPENLSCVNVSARIKASEELNAQMVMDIGGSTNPNEWKAKYLDRQIVGNGEWEEIFVTFEIPETAYPDDELRIFLWNIGENEFWLDDMQVSSFADSRYDHYKTTFRE